MYLSLHLLTYVCQSNHLSVHLLVCTSIYLPVYLSVCLSVFWSLHFKISQQICLNQCMWLFSICLFLSMSVMIKRSNYKAYFFCSKITLTIDIIFDQHANTVCSHKACAATNQNAWFLISTGLFDNPYLITEDIPSDSCPKLHQK